MRLQALLVAANMLVYVCRVHTRNQTYAPNKQEKGTGNALRDHPPVQPVKGSPGHLKPDVHQCAPRRSDRNQTYQVPTVCSPQTTARANASETNLPSKCDPHMLLSLFQEPKWSLQAAASRQIGYNKGCDNVVRC
jgi:hypothetical protein